jgi:hypothetical protein
MCVFGKPDCFGLLRGEKVWRADQHSVAILQIVEQQVAWESVPTLNMIHSNFTNLQDNIVGNTPSSGVENTYTDKLGRTFANGTILDPATTRQLPAWGVDPVSCFIPDRSPLSTLIKLAVDWGVFQRFPRLELLRGFTQ